MIDKAKVWAFYEKAPRPLLRWVASFGAAWAMFGCDLAGMPLDSPTRGVIFGFAALVYGLRGYEKLKEIGDA